VRLLVPGALRLPGDLQLYPRVCPDDRYAANALLTPAEKTSLSGRDPGCIDVGASAAVEAAGDQRRAVTDPSDEGGGAAALHGARGSRRRPFG
jgi:hypothetical protein